MNRLSDIACIAAQRTAIHRLQIILRQTACSELFSQLYVDLFHLLLHISGNLLRLLRRSKRASHAGKEHALASAKQLAHGKALFLRFSAAALLLHQIGCALRLKSGQRFAGHIFSAEHQLSSSSKSSSAALYVARRSSGV